jgi:hypothetical protein
MTFNAGQLPPPSRYRGEQVVHGTTTQRAQNSIHNRDHSTVSYLAPQNSYPPSYSTSTYSVRNNPVIFSNYIPSYSVPSTSHHYKRVFFSSHSIFNGTEPKWAAILLTISGLALACLGMAVAAPELLFLGIVGAALGGIFCIA